MTMKYQRYTFAGSVKDSYRRIICSVWHGATFAVSEQKALANLAFQFKKDTGLAINSRILLDGNILVG